MRGRGVSLRLVSDSRVIAGAEMVQDAICEQLRRVCEEEPAHGVGPDQPASGHPSGVTIQAPYTATRVAMTCVPNTAIKRIQAGRVDHQGPRVRVWKIVRWPATESIKYIIVCRCG